MMILTSLSLLAKTKANLTVTSLHNYKETCVYVGHLSAKVCSILLWPNVGNNIQAL